MSWRRKGDIPGGLFRQNFLLPFVFIGPISYFSIVQAEVAQLVEHQLPKLRVASPSLVFRS